jgi:hypothetical protein
MCLDEPALVPLTNLLAASARQPMTRFEGRLPRRNALVQLAQLCTVSPHLFEQLPSGRRPCQFRLCRVVQRPVKTLDLLGTR